LRQLESIAGLGLGGVIREAHSTVIFQVLYLSIDIHPVFFHGEIEDGLSISGLEKGNLSLKFSTGFQRPPAHFISPHRFQQDPKMAEIYLKE
jgi:hypothetical protein